MQCRSSNSFGSRAAKREPAFCLRRPRHQQAAIVLCSSRLRDRSRHWPQLLFSKFSKIYFFQTPVFKTGFLKPTFPEPAAESQRYSPETGIGGRGISTGVPRHARWGVYFGFRRRDRGPIAFSARENALQTTRKPRENQGQTTTRVYGCVSDVLATTDRLWNFLLDSSDNTCHT